MTPVTPPPPPIPGAPAPVTGEADEVPEPILRVIRLAISAAGADGTLSDEERAEILSQARQANAEALVERELHNPRPLGEIVFGVTDPAVKGDLYVLAFAIVRADESVSGAERIYLAQLAHHLGLSAEETGRLEREAVERIDREAGEGDQVK